MTEPAVDTILAGLVPISLEQLDDLAALRERTDRKHVLTLEVLARVLGELGGDVRALELNGRRQFSYHSVYHDTPDLSTYAAHVQRRRLRCKLRTRHYVDSGHQVLELKRKGARGETIKRRTNYPHEYFRPLSHDAVEFLRASAPREFPSSGLLHPTLLVAYSRATLVLDDGRERVTIDTDVSFQDAGGARAALAPGHALVESKSVAGRGRFLAALRAAGVQPVRCSKYVLGVALTRDPGRDNDLRRLIRRYCVLNPADGGIVGEAC